MLFEKLKRLLLIRSMLDQLSNGLEPITALAWAVWQACSISLLECLWLKFNRP